MVVILPVFDARRSKLARLRQGYGGSDEASREGGKFEVRAAVFATVQV
jgi:hypothetical protein